VGGRLVGPERLLELGWRHVVELAMQSPVVEPVDVFGDGDLDVADVLPSALGRMTGLRMHSALNNEFSVSAIALSYESPLLPTEVTAMAPARRSV
jgi:hypothetical protein